MSARWRTIYVVFAYFYALFYVGVLIGPALSIQGTLDAFNWAANLVGLSGSMGSPADTIALPFLFAYFMMLTIACFMCARDPRSATPLVFVCAGKATSGATFLVMALTLRPAYAFIFLLDVFNIVTLAGTWWLANRGGAASDDAGLSRRAAR